MKTYEEARYNFTRRYLKSVMMQAQGRVAVAAKLADRHRTDFYKLLHRHRLENLISKRHRGKLDVPVPEDW